MINVKVAIDDGPQFPALIDPSVNWNGWLIPWFTKEAALDVLRWASDDPHTKFRWVGDVIVATHTPDGDDPVVERLDPRMVDGVPRWAIGGHMWTWMQVLDEEGNSLEGIFCPVCGQDEEFSISTFSIAIVSKAGIEHVSESEWDLDSRICCSVCDHTGIVKDFTRG